MGNKKTCKHGWGVEGGKVAFSRDSGRAVVLLHFTGIWHRKSSLVLQFLPKQSAMLFMVEAHRTSSECYCCWASMLSLSWMITESQSNYSVMTSHSDDAVSKLRKVLCWGHARVRRECAGVSVFKGMKKICLTERTITHHPSLQWSKWAECIMWFV